LRRDASTHHRDLNAAKNLERFAASSAVIACGEIRDGVVRKSRVKRASTKQEEKDARLAEAA
jgi:putative transposase